MNYIGKVISNFKEAYNDINSATLTGAIDVVVVRQENETFTTSPFHVRFGKIGVLRSKEKVVDIEINGEPVDIHMKLGESGEAFFVEEIREGEEINHLLGTSPLPSFCFGRHEDVKSLDSGLEAEEMLYKKFTNNSEECSCSSNAKQSLNFGNSKEDSSDKYNDASGVDNDAVGIWLDYNQTEKSTQTGQSSFLNHGEDGLDGARESDIDLVSCCHISPIDYDSCVQNDLQNIKVSAKETSSAEEGKIDKEDSANLIHGSRRYATYDTVLSKTQGSKTDGEECVRVSRNQRRRRRKRANLRHSKALDSPSSEHSTTSETSDVNSLLNINLLNNQDSFLLKDVTNVEESVKLKVCQSLSMPMLYTKRNEDYDVDWIHPMSRSMAHDFHPFSDTDISPPPSPNRSRTNTPIKSDTEYEVEKQKSELFKEGHGPEVTWTWGQFPTPTSQARSQSFQQLNCSRRHSSCVELDKSIKGSENKTINLQVKKEAEAAAAQRSMLGSMLSFMRATKSVRHNPECEGIYLDQLNLDDLDPEVAALYFPRHSNKALFDKCTSGFTNVTKDEDVESGNGTSLPQSPNSLEGALSSSMEYEETPTDPLFDYRIYHDLSFSLCGSLMENIDGDFPESLFLQSLVTYDDFCQNTSMMDDPNLVVRLGGKYMNWSTAAPQLLSLLLFQRPLPKPLTDRLEHDNMPKKEMRKRSESRSYHRWFNWGSKKEEGDLTNTNLLSTFWTELRGDYPILSKKFMMPSTYRCETGLSSMRTIKRIDSQSPLKTASVVPMDESQAGMLKYNSASLDQAESLDRSLSSIQTESFCYDVGENVNSLALARQSVVENPKRIRHDSSCSDESVYVNKKYKKSLRLSSHKLAKLNLTDGLNKVVFSVTTAYQGTTRCECNIFLWQYDDNIIVSDIDGTITKSDVWGHILPIIGKDWAQGGVAQLFTKIKNNGYNFLYLSARAIGQAHNTREYLRSIKQGDVSLPDGPLLLNPTSLLQAFHREVIIKKPEEFKISCLRDIQALFPRYKNPFYAGYGNRVNDVWAYRAVGIPISRIFTINYKGELRHELTQAFQTTYPHLSDIVNHMFPHSNAKVGDTEYTTFSFWKDPLPDMSLEIEEVLKDAKSS